MNYKYYIFIICIFLSASCDIIRTGREFNYGIPVSIENNSKDKMLILIFPILISSTDVLEENNIKQIQLNPGESKFILYYLGRNINMENIIVCITVWNMKSEHNINSNILSSEPYLFKTYYDPKFEIGPEKYGIFAKLVIE